MTETQTSVVLVDLAGAVVAHQMTSRQRGTASETDDAIAKGFDEILRAAGGRRCLVSALPCQASSTTPPGPDPPWCPRHGRRLRAHQLFLDIREPPTLPLKGRDCLETVASEWGMLRELSNVAGCDIPTSEAAAGAPTGTAA